MTGAPQMDRARTVETLARMAADYRARHGRPPSLLIVVGGSAMVLRGLRERSEDVDLYHPDEDFAPIASDLERRSGLRIDVTHRKNLWGDLVIRDIEHDAEVLERVEIEGFSVDLAAISPQTLFVIKASSLREKDRSDLFLLAPVVTPQNVLARAQGLLEGLEDYLREDILCNLVSELQMVYETPLEEGWFREAGMLWERYGATLASTFRTPTAGGRAESPGAA